MAFYDDVEHERNIAAGRLHPIPDVEYRFPGCLDNAPSANFKALPPRPISRRASTSLCKSSREFTFAQRHSLSRTSPLGPFWTHCFLLDYIMDSGRQHRRRQAEMDGRPDKPLDAWLHDAFVLAHGLDDEARDHIRARLPHDMLGRLRALDSTKRRRLADKRLVGRCGDVDPSRRRPCRPRSASLPAQWAPPVRGPVDWRGHCVRLAERWEGMLAFFLHHCERRMYAEQARDFGRRRLSGMPGGMARAVLEFRDWAYRFDNVLVVFRQRYNDGFDLSQDPYVPGYDPSNPMGALADAAAAPKEPAAAVPAPAHRELSEQEYKQAARAIQAALHTLRSVCDRCRAVQKLLTQQQDVRGGLACAELASKINQHGEAGTRYKDTPLLTKQAKELAAMLALPIPDPKGHPKEPLVHGCLFPGAAAAGTTTIRAWIQRQRALASDSYALAKLRCATARRDLGLASGAGARRQMADFLARGRARARPLDQGRWAAARSSAHKRLTAAAGAGADADADADAEAGSPDVDDRASVIETDATRVVWDVVDEERARARARRARDELERRYAERERRQREKNENEAELRREGREGGDAAWDEDPGHRAADEENAENAEEGDRGSNESPNSPRPPAVGKNSGAEKGSAEGTPGHGRGVSPTPSQHERKQSRVQNWWAGLRRFSGLQSRTSAEGSARPSSSTPSKRQSTADTSAASMLETPISEPDLTPFDAGVQDNDKGMLRWRNPFARDGKKQSGNNAGDDVINAI